MPKILQLLASPVHRFEGRPADGPAAAPEGELVSEIRLRAGLGVVGDRYFNHPAHRDASVTLVSAEALPPGLDLRLTRRNVLISGLEVDALVGSVLTLDSGAGPLRLAVRRAANPCAWLDVSAGWTTGTWRSLRGRAGVRCVPLDDGILRVGPVGAYVVSR